MHHNWKYISIQSPIKNQFHEGHLRRRRNQWILSVLIHKQNFRHLAFIGSSSSHQGIINLDPLAIKPILLNIFQTQTFSFKENYLQISFAKCFQLCPRDAELRWVTTRKQKWCQFLENLHKYSLKYIGFNHAKQIMGYHACFWDILTNITHEIETKLHIITHLG